jgi:hypothetical protein
VFISYRREDTGDFATALSVRLREDLGSRNVFRDQDDLIVGDRWQETLDEWMAESDAAVFLVGDKWTGQREDGTSRILEDDDPVRHEVLQALHLEEAALPLPFLVDLHNPPADLPGDISPLFSDHHYGTVRWENFQTGSSSDYQTILVGIWNALRRRVPRGVLILGERDGMASLDSLVRRLGESGQLEARHLSRFASGAYIASVRESRKLTRRWSDVIVNIEREEPTEELRSRLAAIAAVPEVKRVTLVGIGAVAGAALSRALGGPTFETSSSDQLATALGQHAGAGVGRLGSAWSSAGIGAKIAVVATASAISLGGAGAVVQVLDSGLPRFGEATELSPFGGSDDAFPLGEPAPMTVNLGPPQLVNEEEAQNFFANFEGGTAERRSVTILYRDTGLQLGDIIVPISFPHEFIEQNVGVFTLTTLTSEGEVRLIENGAGAANPCVYDRTGDVVGGWRYTGDPGLVSLDLLFESDGTSVIDVGMQLSFDGRANVVFLEDVVEDVIPNNVDISDSCTPVERMETIWTFGIAESG